MGSLSLASNAQNSSITISLSGTGVEPLISVTPSNVSFGNVPVGATSTQAVTVSNPGNANLNVTQAAGPGAGFSVSGLTTPLTVPPGQSAKFSISFSPTVAGSLTSSFALVSNAPASPMPVSISGAGVQPSSPQISVTPGDLTFGSVTVGGSGKQSVTVSNTGSANLSITAANVTGSGFSTSSLPLPMTVAAGGSTTITVNFAPSTSGSVTGSLSLTSNAPTSPTAIALSGTGVVAPLTLTANPTILNFGNVTVGSTNSQNVTLTNNGNSNVTVSSVTVSGAGFSTNGVAPGATLVPSQSITLNVAFASTVVGSVTGSVSVVSNATNSPTTISLSGAGVQSQINVVSNGAVPDSKEGLQCAVSSGSNSLVCQDLTFASSDVGHIINIYGAVSTTNYDALYTTITAVTNSSTVTLAAPATRTVSSAMVQVVGATNNLSAIQNTINAACSAATQSNPSTVSFPAGIYGLAGTLFIPNGCSYVTLTSGGGPVVLLETAIVSNVPGATGFGQGAALLAFGNSSAPGRLGNSLSGISISAGSNVLTCTACAFTTADIGKPIYVQYAGAANVPLWSTITAVNGTQAILADNAQTTLPLSPQGIQGPLIIIGYQVMKNINIGGMDFHNIGYWSYSNQQNPGSSILGLPVIQFGAASQVVKQGLTFHNTTVLTATNNCTANNGPMDGATWDTITCLGSIDAGFYLSGIYTNSTLRNLTVDNTGYPVPENILVSSARLEDAILMKPGVNVLLDHPVVRCYCVTEIVGLGDYNNFDVTIQNGDFNGESATSTGIFSNITKRLTIQNNSFQGITGNVFELSSTYPGSIDNISITGNTASNSGAAISVSDLINSGAGPSNINFQNNVMQVTGNGIIATSTRGTNHWSLNQLTNVPAANNAAWQIFQSAPGTTNFVGSNTVSGYLVGSVCDSSCVFSSN